MSGKKARQERKRKIREDAEFDTMLRRTDEGSLEERRGGWPDWTPFVETHRADQFCREAQCEATFVNSRYQVFVSPVKRILGWPPMYYLSFKTHSRRAVIPWRDKQRIKNEICGTKSEAVELFPAEERLMDTSNQYHLFVIHPDCEGFPFGQVNRDIMEPEEAEATGARQATFQPHHNADGCTTHGVVGWKPMAWYKSHDPKHPHAAMWRVNDNRTAAEEAV